MKEITDIKEVQSIALNILVHVDKICRENNIKYSLCGGTLIGAIRHKGFIPWDDDIDIMMPRDEYERFLKIMDEDSKTNDKIKCLHYDDKYPNYFYRFAKVCDISTELQEGRFIRNENLGVFVDVFPADGIDMKKAVKLSKKSKRYSELIARASTVNIPKNKNLLKYLAKKIILYPYAKSRGYKYWWNKHEKLVKSYKNEDWEYCNLYSGGIIAKEIFPISYFDNLIEVKFENYKFLAIKEYDKYLTRTYGDYMTPPPPEERISHHDFKIYKKEG